MTHQFRTTNPPTKGTTMKLSRTLAVTAAALILAATPAAADTSYTYTGPIVAGVPTTFSTTAGCSPAPCRYQWRAFGTGYSRLGTVLADGYTQSATITFPAPRSLTLQLKITNSGRTHGFTTAQQYITVK